MIKYLLITTFLITSLISNDQIEYFGLGTYAEAIKKCNEANAELINSEDIDIIKDEFGIGEDEFGIDEDEILIKNKKSYNLQNEFYIYCKVTNWYEDEDENQINKDLLEKPKEENFTKSPYELDEEFKQRKKLSLERWKAKVKEYEKEIEKMATPISGGGNEITVKFELPLKGIGEREEKVQSINKTFDFNKAYPFKLVLGQNENEEFYIKNIYFDDKHDKINKNNIKESNNKTDFIEVTLDEDIVVQTKLSNGDVGEKQFKRGKNISINFSRFEIKDEKNNIYKFKKNPKLKKSIKNFKIDIHKENNETYIRAIVETHFKIEDIEVTIFEENIKLKKEENKINNLKFETRFNYFAIRSDVLEFKIKLEAKDFTIVYDCEKKDDKFSCNPR